MVRETGERTDREVSENIEQKLQNPSRAVERILDPTAVPGLRRVEGGDPATCSRSAVKNGAQELQDLFKTVEKHPFIKAIFFSQGYYLKSIITE